MPQLTFRCYQPADRETCRQIIASQIGSYLASGEERDFEWFLDQVESGQHPIVFWLAERNGEVIGCCGLWMEDDIATLCWGVLRAGELSKGFGKEMLLHRLEWLENSRPEVKSVLSDTAAATEGFFAKYGFVTYLRLPGYWKGKLDLVAMELTYDGNMRGPERTNKKLEAQKQKSSQV